MVRHFGLQLDEPSLVFADRRSGAPVSDPHPVRGIVTNRPFDFSLTQSGLATSVRLGIVCPERDSELLARNVQRFNERLQPGRSERDYLIEYPGFERAFGLPISLPSPGGTGWASYPDPDPALDAATGALELAGTITRTIDAVRASYGASVILVFVPARYARWRRFETENERFDLHDFVKAYCVQRGVATQFLEQDTFDDPLQCRVWWWLALAMYAKSMRTPWVLNSLDSDTAFIGLGFSIHQAARLGGVVKPHREDRILARSVQYNTI